MFYMIDIWYIYLDLVDFYGKLDGKYTIHGSYGCFVAENGQFEQPKHETWKWQIIVSMNLTRKTPRKLQHTPGAHPRQSPYPTVNDFLLQPVGEGSGVCSKGVLKQPAKNSIGSFSLHRSFSTKEMFPSYADTRPWGGGDHSDWLDLQRGYQTDFRKMVR